MFTAKVFLLLALGTQAYAVSSPVTTDNASMSLSLVSKQALLISCSARSAKLPFFQKATADAPSPLLLCAKGGYLFSGAYGKLQTDCIAMNIMVY